jgi:hypothetical protein
LGKIDEFFIRKIEKFERIDKKVGLFWQQNPKITDNLSKDMKISTNRGLLMENMPIFDKNLLILAHSEKKILL